MSWLNKYNLFQLKKKANPTKEFRNALWYKLSEHYDSVYQNSVPERNFGFAVLRYSAVALSLVLALTMGTGVYAYSSSDVSSVHPLFPVKRTLEKVEKKLAKTPAQKTTFNLKQLDRRRAELAKLDEASEAHTKAAEALDEAEEEGIKDLEGINSPEVRSNFIQKISESDLQNIASIQKNTDSKLVNEKVQKIKKRWQKLSEDQEKITETQMELQTKLHENINEKEVEISSFEN